MNGLPPRDHPGGSAAAGSPGVRVEPLDPRGQPWLVHADDREIVLRRSSLSVGVEHVRWLHRFLHRWRREASQPEAANGPGWSERPRGRGCYLGSGVILAWPASELGSLHAGRVGRRPPRALPSSLTAMSMPHQRLVPCRWKPAARPPRQPLPTVSSATCQMPDTMRPHIVWYTATPHGPICWSLTPPER
jgi:hypothetical protein